MGATGRFIRQDRQQGRESDHSHLVQAKNEWSLGPLRRMTLWHGQGQPYLHCHLSFLHGFSLSDRPTG